MISMFSVRNRINRIYHLPKENIYKYYDKLLNLLYLCGKYKSSNIYLIAVIHFLIYVFDND